jgi:inner membrane protein
MVLCAGRKPRVRKQLSRIMATIYTHAFVGLGIAPLYVPRCRRWLYWTLAAVLAVAPDFDAFSTAAYGSTFGHRGFTHSLPFALWAGFLTASLAFRPLGGSFWVLSGLFFAAMASHGLLDAMTRGGADIPFFWPASDERYGNWGPIPLSDIAFQLPDPRRSRALRSEMLWIWLPVSVFVIALAIFRRTRAGAGKNCESS